MDIKTAFLNGDLEEEIYMEQPEGFMKPGEEHLVCKLGAGAVGRKSKKQTSVALSSTEAEYMALTQTTKEAMWIKHLLTELGELKEGHICINADNPSCIALAKNPEFHARTKHIDI